MGLSSLIRKIREDRGIQSEILTFRIIIETLPEILITEKCNFLKSIYLAISFSNNLVLCFMFFHSFCVFGLL